MKIRGILMEKNWENFFIPYQQAVDELKIKLRGIRKQYQEENRHSPIEFVTGRVKKQASIEEKMRYRHISEVELETEMTDIAGLRIMCQFVEDIYDIIDLLEQRTDFKVVDRRDYISNKKESGYRSYHLMIEYPVETLNGRKKIYAEIQIRTLSMNFWATIEHSLNYKYDGEFPDEINVKLQRAAEASFLLDKEMSEIREEIQEAQHLFSYGKGNRYRQKKDNQNQEE